MMTSTLVETVSINYEDFSESFLTCSTCMCVYDSQDHSPKLLPCSHTVCKHCLERILAAQTRDTGTFRCPICRDTITLPRGGVQAFPPSFLVNQLLDLMATQRRDVIPKCSMHTGQELLFCETCDVVFCTVCTGGTHGSNCEHTVIPFSIAIKRMSEILLYKAHQCISNLNRAYDNVKDEMHKLDVNVDKNFDTVNKSFQDLVGAIEKRRYEVLQMVTKVRDEKRKVLAEQLKIIEAEKSKVEHECEGLQYQVEVRNITQKISDLNEKLDSTSTLAEPRENSFLRYEYKHNSCLRDVCKALTHFGEVHTSKTFPALSAVVPHTQLTGTAHLQCLVEVMTVDYHGNPRLDGGDPVTAVLSSDSNQMVETSVIDFENGLYSIKFTPPSAGTFKLNITIFERPIKDSPLTFEVSEHNNPVAIFGSRGSSQQEFIQPVGIAIGKDNTMYVSDTGNSRVKVLSDAGTVLSHLPCEGLENQSGTGIALSPLSDTLIVCNWRSKYVTEFSAEGNITSRFTCAEFVEPVDVAVNSHGEVLVADTGACRVFLFDASGKLIKRLGVKGINNNSSKQLQLVTAVSFGRNDDVIVANSKIQIFNRNTGKMVREVYPEGKGKGTYGGICVDREGHILATRCEKGRGFVQVFTYNGRLLFNIDSHESKLKRPSGIAVTNDFHVLVVDLGNDSVKKYKYQ